MSSPPNEAAGKSLRAQVADSMVAQYLQSAGYEYSLSIFLPEAGVSIDKVKIFLAPKGGVLWFACVLSSAQRKTFSSF